MNKIVFRVDGNSIIGSGHVMRCLSIANAAKNKGIECIFVTSDNSFEQTIISQGFSNIILNINYVDISKDLSSFKYQLGALKPDLVIVDSYNATNDLFKTIKCFSKVLYIDDLNAFDQNVDYLLNYNEIDFTYSSKYKNKKYILGTSFIPLRKEFQNLVEIKTRKDVNNVFFFAGGGDPERFTLPFVEKVRSINEFNQIMFHIVIGKFEPDKEAIYDISKRTPNIRVYENISNMAEVIRKCEITVSASGSTLYEICACGVPCITYVTEDNQIISTNFLSKNKVMVLAGDYRTTPNMADVIVDNIIILSNDFDKRVEMHTNSIKLVDGKGAERIVDYIINN